MSNNVKDIDIKNHTYYFFSDIINIKNFDSNNTKIGEKSQKDLRYVRIYSVNPLYLIFNKENGYFEEIIRNKYLTLVPTNENKGKIKNMKIFGVKSEI